MKILLAGGGTGGHFFPLIAVTRSIYKISELQRIGKIEIFFMSDDPINNDLLLINQIKFIKIPAGKMRRYFSFLNLIDLFKLIFGIIVSFFKIYSLFPDVIFSKGGYASFPVLLSARFLKIPIIIHESDSIPGIVNKWSGKWARSVAISFAETAKFFKQEKTIFTGNPVRQQILGGNEAEAIQKFDLEERVPVVLFLGGSQGAEKINENVLEILPAILKNFQVIHQTGSKNFNDVFERSKIILNKFELTHRYHVFPFLNEGELKNAAKATSLVVSRAGAGSIFEIAAWGLPSILIPISDSAQNHQRENAYIYAGNGACEIIEEENLKPHLLLAQIEKILYDNNRREKMSLVAKNFSMPNASDLIAQEIIRLGTHD